MVLYLCIYCNICNLHSKTLINFKLVQLVALEMFLYPQKKGDGTWGKWHVEEDVQHPLDLYALASFVIVFTQYIVRLSLIIYLL